jgi:hypothetical protein
MHKINIKIVCFCLTWAMMIQLCTSLESSTDILLYFSTIKICKSCKIQQILKNSDNSTNKKKTALKQMFGLKERAYLGNKRIYGSPN